MSDNVFEVVGDAPANDATADFLAQERELLGDDANFGGEEVDLTNGVQQLNLVEGEGATGEDDDDDTLFLQGGNEPEEEVDPNATYNDDGTPAEDDAYAMPSMQAMPQIEPEPVREWRAKRDTALVEKDAAEQIAIAKMQEDAAAKLKDVLNHHAETIGNTHKANMMAEEEFIANRDTQTEEHDWAGVNERVDFNFKCKAQKKDTTRLRSLMISLKAA